MRDHQRYTFGIAVQYHTAGKSDTKKVLFSYERYFCYPWESLYMNAGEDLMIDKISRVSVYSPYGAIEESPTPGETTLINQIFSTWKAMHPYIPIGSPAANEGINKMRKLIDDFYSSSASHVYYTRDASGNYHRHIGLIGGPGYFYTYDDCDELLPPTYGMA